MGVVLEVRSRFQVSSKLINWFLGCGV